MNLLDGKVVTVEGVTQEMMDWLEESDIKYNSTPHLERWKYSGCFGETQNDLIKGGPRRESDFHRIGDYILFNREEDRMHFQLRFAEEIITGENPFEF